MARTIAANTLAQMAAGSIVKIDMVLFDFPQPTGPIGLFSGVGEFQWGGVPYHGTGDLLDVTDVGAGTDGSAIGLVIQLNNRAREGLGPSVLAQLETVAYRGAPVHVFRRYSHPLTYEELSTEALWTGFIDYVSHEDTEGGSSAVSAHCESVLIDLSRSGHRMRTDADQRAIDGSDGFLEHVATQARKELQVGKIPPAQPAPKRKKFLGIF